MQSNAPSITVPPGYLPDIDRIDRLVGSVVADQFAELAKQDPRLALALIVDALHMTFDTQSRENFNTVTVLATLQQLVQLV